LGDTGATDQLGRAQFTASLTGATKWVVHGQQERDYGVDSTVELTEPTGRPDGGRVALQLKSGLSYFSREAKSAEGEVTGWWRPVPKRHRDYWTKHPMPVYIVLVNTDTGQWYWQRLTTETCVPAGKNYKVLIPTNQVVDAAAVRWRQDAETFRALTQQGQATLGRLLPPSTRRELEVLAATDSGLADLIAAHLASGEPELNLELLLGASDSWLAAAPDYAWTAVGSYANEHELFEQACTAYEIAAQACKDDPTRSGGLLAIAGACAAGVDAERSAELLAQAEATGSEVGGRRAALTRIANDPGALASFDPDAWRGITDPGLANLAAIVSSLHHQHHDRLDSAVSEARRSLALAPDASRTMLLLADLLLIRSGTSQMQAGDAAAALDQTSRCRLQRQTWNGPTKNLLALELKAFAILSRDDEALALVEATLGDDQRRADLLGDHVATTMATDLLVTFGRIDLAEQLAGRLERGSLARDVIEYRLCTADDARRSTDWEGEGRGLVQRAIAANDERLATALLATLGARGSDVTDVYDALVGSALLTKAQQNTLKAQIAAAHDLDASLPQLRTAARHALGAAEVLLGMLAAAGRLDEAKTELELLAARYSKATLAPIVVPALMRAGRHGEAAELARDGLATGTLEGRDRTTLLRVAIEAAATGNDWMRVETLSRDELNRLAGLNAAAVADDIETYTWARLAALIRLRRHGDAADLLATSGVTPDNVQHLQTWVQATAYRGFDEGDVTTFLTCLETVVPEPKIAGRLLGIVFGSYTTTKAAHRNATRTAGDAAGVEDQFDEELEPVDERAPGRRLYRALEQHRQTHGEIPGIVAKEVEESEEGVQVLLDEFAAQLRAQAEALDDIRIQVLGGAPLGLLSAVIGRPYARAVIGRVVGYIPAVTTDEAAFEREVEAATAAIGGTVVVEASTLHIVASLGRTELTGHFGSVVLSERSRDDITSCLLASRADRASSGQMGFDLAAGRMTLTDGPDPATETLIALAERLDRQASGCVIRPVPVSAGEEAYSGDDVDDDADEHELEPGRTHEEALGPWLDAVELAAAQEVPLWSDDIGLRTLATSKSVPAFSTAGLLEALLEADRLDAADIPGLRADLIRCGVADLDVTDDELLAILGEAGAARETNPAAAHEGLTGIGMKLSRPSFMHGRPTALTSARTLIEQAAVYDQRWSETLTYQFLNGLAAGVPGEVVLEGAVILSLGGTPIFEAARTARYLELARQVLVARRQDDPVAMFPSILENGFNGLADHEQMTAAVLDTLLPTGSVEPTGSAELDLAVEPGGDV
jgi:hypothetical protein